LCCVFSFSVDAPAKLLTSDSSFRDLVMQGGATHYARMLTLANDADAARRGNAPVDSRRRVSYTAE
jgi:hypothetical protein